MVDFRLSRALSRHAMQLPSNVVNTLDTLPTFRSLWPALRSYRLQDLVSEKLQGGGQSPPDMSSFPHDAISDARALQRLVAFVPPARRFIVQRHLSDEFTLSTGTVEQRLAALTVAND